MLKSLMITKHVTRNLSGMSSTLLYAKCNCVQLLHNKIFAFLCGYFMYKLFQHQTVMPQCTVNRFHHNMNTVLYSIQCNRKLSLPVTVYWHREDPSAVGRQVRCYSVTVTRLVCCLCSSVSKVGGY
jgi:hypothetical protein